MAAELTGKRIAVVATDGFERSELIEPRNAVWQAGATAEVVSPTRGRIKAEA